MKYSPQQIDLWFSRFNERFQKVPELIAETATEHFKERFTQGNWEGNPWPKRKDKKPHRLMMKERNLFSSIRPTREEPGRVIISGGSAKVRYARVHNEGLRVRGIQYVRPYTHPNLLGKGRRQVQGHTRRIDFQMPRRQFMGPSRMLNARIMARIKTHFNAK